MAKRRKKVPTAGEQAETVPVLEPAAKRHNTAAKPEPEVSESTTLSTISKLIARSKSSVSSEPRAESEESVYVPAFVAPRPTRPATVASAPRVVIDATGRMTIDTSALTVAVDQSEHSVGAGPREYKYVVEHGASVMGGAPTHRKAYSKRREVPKRVERWSKEETEKFYKMLRVFGTDFTLMEGAFKAEGRDQKQIKAKFKREEKTHPELVDLALRRPLPLTAESLAKAGMTIEQQKDDNELLEDLLGEKDSDEEKEDSKSPKL